LPVFLDSALISSRFTSYDFKKTQRRSYYPHNEHTTSTVTATSSIMESRPVTPVPHDLGLDSVQGADGTHHNGTPISDYNDITSLRLEKMVSEKEYH
jgi:serine/threonine kinase 32